MNTNAELCNTNWYDGLINSDGSLGKNKAGKDNLVDSRELIKKEQNETASRGKIWSVCGNTLLVYMIALCCIPDECDSGLCPSFECKAQLKL